MDPDQMALGMTTVYPLVARRQSAPTDGPTNRPFAGVAPCANRVNKRPAGGSDRAAQSVDRCSASASSSAWSATLAASREACASATRRSAFSCARTAASSTFACGRCFALGRPDCVAGPVAFGLELSPSRRLGPGRTNVLCPLPTGRVLLCRRARLGRSCCSATAAVDAPIRLSPSTCAPAGREAPVHQRRGRRDRRPMSPRARPGGARCPVGSRGNGAAVRSLPTGRRRSRVGRPASRLPRSAPSSPP